MKELFQKILDPAGGRGWTSNPGLKLASLLLAILAWFIIANQDKSEIDVSAPLTINLPSGLALATPPPAEVKVRLRGRRNALARLTPGDVQVAVDLARAQAGRQIELLDSQNIQIPFGLEVASVAPTSLILELVSIIERKVPIQPNLTGEVPSGFRVRETLVEPPEARVSGSESLFMDDVTVSTEPVKLNGRENTFSTTVKVLSPLAGLDVVSPAQVTVSVRIEELRETRTFTVPIDLTGTPQGRLQINPTELAVTVEGAASRLTDVRVEDLQVLLEVGNLSPSREDYHVEPKVKLRRPDAFAGIQILALGQQRIDVHVYPE